MILLILPSIYATESYNGVSFIAILRIGDAFL